MLLDSQRHGKLNSALPLVLGELVQETLTRRLFIQLQRRPSTLIAGIIQPVMWLVLFERCFRMRHKDYW